MASPFVSGDIRTGVESIFRKLLVAPVFALLLAASATGMAQAQQAPPAGATFEERHAALTKRDDLQFEFTPPPKLELRPQPPRSWLDDVFDGLQPFLEAVFWIALILGGLALLAFVYREVWVARRDKADKPKTAVLQTSDFRPEAGKARALLAEADRLAGEGKFDEAVRRLLHRSIDDIEERVPNSIRKAQTSREIAGMPQLPEQVRGAFAPITRAVEDAWFGGRPVDAARYQACRKAYSDFALPEAWTAPRAAAGAPA
jgi:hypothetical protein